MDAVVTAGGVPGPDEPLYEYTRGESKALVDVSGKPMVQWVLDAIGGAANVERVVVVGLQESSGVSSSKPLAFVPNQGGMIDNIRAGTRRVLDLNPGAEFVLVASADIPTVTAEMVDWVVARAGESRHDLYYNVVPRQVMEGRFPGANRTFIRLKDMELCGGDMNVAAVRTVVETNGIWDQLSEARKSVLRQAALVGFDTLLYLLLRRLDLEGAIRQVSKNLGIAGRAVVCPYAEIAMDVDKPHQLEIVRADLSGSGAG